MWVDIFSEEDEKFTTSKYGKIKCFLNICCLWFLLALIMDKTVETLYQITTHLEYHK